MTRIGTIVFALIGISSLTAFADELSVRDAQPDEQQMVEDFVYSSWITDSEEKEYCEKDPPKFNRLLNKSIDLNDDGSTEYLVLGPLCFCSPTGNCPFTVVSREGEKFRILTQQLGIQRFEASAERTNGYQHLETARHMSAFESTHFTATYNGSLYRVIKCEEWQYSGFDERGERREFDPPRVRECEK